MRRDGVSDADLEPLFRSADAYIRMWEYAWITAHAGPYPSRRCHSKLPWLRVVRGAPVQFGYCALRAR